MLKLTIETKDGWGAPWYVAGLTLGARPQIFITEEPRRAPDGVTVDQVDAIMSEAASSFPAMTGYLIEQGAFRHEVAA